MLVLNIQSSTPAHGVLPPTLRAVRLHWKHLHRQAREVCLLRGSKCTQAGSQDITSTLGEPPLWDRFNAIVHTLTVPAVLAQPFSGV